MNLVWHTPPAPLSPTKGPRVNSDDGVIGVVDEDERDEGRKVDFEMSMDELHAYRPSKRKSTWGRHKNLRNRAAYLMPRLKELPRIREG